MYVGSIELILAKSNQLPRLMRYIDPVAMMVKYTWALLALLLVFLITSLATAATTGSDTHFERPSTSNGNELAWKWSNSQGEISVCFSKMAMFRPIGLLLDMKTINSAHQTISRKTCNVFFYFILTNFNKLAVFSSFFLLLILIFFESIIPR